MNKIKPIIWNAAMVMAVVMFSGTAKAEDCKGWVSEGWIPFSQFWESADLAKVKACIAQGEDPNARDERGRTPLHRAAGWNRNPAMIDALVRHGADAHARDKFGGAPLFDAASYNDNPAIIDALIRHGADVDARTVLFGATPPALCG